MTGDDDKQEHDPLSCLQETRYRGLPVWPECPSGYDLFGLSCLKHCKSGYDTFGFMCEGSCPSGFRDDGAFCAKTKSEWYGPWYRRRFRWTQSCPSGMSDWGATCKKNEYHRETAPQSCPEDEEAGICYNECDDGFYGIAGVCWGECPTGTDQCGVICLGPTENCTERIISITEGAMRMAALAASSPSGIGAVLAIKEAYEFGEDVNYPICNA